MLFSGSHSAGWTFNGFHYNDVAAIPLGSSFFVHTVAASKTFTMTDATFLVQGWGDGGFLEAIIAGNDASGDFAGGNIATAMPVKGRLTPVQCTLNSSCYVTEGLDVVIFSVASPRSFSYSISGIEA